MPLFYCIFKINFLPYFVFDFGHLDLISCDFASSLLQVIQVEAMNHAASYASLLKRVLLEWSESKSDGKFGFSMLKNPHVQIFGEIGATSGI